MVAGGDRSWVMHPLDQTPSCRRLRAAFLEKSGVGITARDDVLVDAPALAAEVLRRWGRVRLGRGPRRARARPQWLSDRPDPVKMDRELVFGTVGWILLISIGGGLVGLWPFVFRWGPEMLLFGVPAVLLMIAIFRTTPAVYVSMDAGECPLCQYDVGSLGPRLVGRGADGEKFEVRTGPPECPECGCPWPLVPRS